MDKMTKNTVLITAKDIQRIMGYYSKPADRIHDKIRLFTDKQSGQPK